MTVLRTGLIGANLSRSRFADGLGLMCRAHGLTLDFRLIDTGGRPDFDLPAELARLAAQGWRGVAVTHPWKSAAAAWVGTGMAPAVRALGSCNLVLFDTPPTGENTDFTGFLGAWSAIRGDAPPGRVAMAGAGGVARAIGPALAGLGATGITLWDSDADRARDLAERIGPIARAIPEAEAPAAVAAADGLVNATPLGMHAYPGSAFPAPLPGRPAWAFDAVYTPVETRFLKSAKSAGADIVTGFEMFRHMAIGSFRALTGIDPEPRSTLAMLDALKPQEETT